MPTEIDWARLAAFIDGEGCIDIHTHRQFRKHLGRVYERLYVRITVVNTDPRLAMWCKEVFGGTAYRDKSNLHKTKWKPRLIWYISSQKAVDVIKGCMPYFLLKREQAEIAIAFQETVHRNFGRTGHPKATMEARAVMQKKIALLKHQRIDFDTATIH